MIDLATSTSTQDRETEALPELTVLHSDGSWRPMALCVATPEQLGAVALPSETVQGFVARARKADLALDGVIAMIRRHWGA